MNQRLQPSRVPDVARVAVLRRLVVLIAVVLSSSVAVAQEAGQTPAPGTPSAESPTGLSEVVVTGSRIQRSTFNTPNPVTVIDSKDINNLGIVNVGEVLGELPQNSNFFAANNVGLGNFNVGAQLANLRGLNPFFGTRTLTLIDTQRVVPQATGGGVDVTLIPSMLVGRTEVVTGGASALYGSDAVAGVVNIILDKKLNGFKGQADYGQTSHHDGGDSHLSLAYGSDLGDRTHFIVGGEYENSEDIGICSQVREWCKSQYALFTNSLYAPVPAAPPVPAIPANGQPHYIIGPNGTLANQSQTGVLTPCNLPLSSPVCVPTGPQYIFDSAGTAASPFNPGLYADGAGVFGFSQGAGATGVGAYDGTTLKPSVKRYTALGNVDFRITDNLSSFLEVSYARSEAVNPVANGAIGPIALEVGRGAFVPLSSHIAPDNPYLPAQFQPGGANALPPSIPVPPPFCASPPCGNSLGGALLGYNMNAIYPARNETNNDTVRVVGGLNGRISENWSWDAYFEWGKNYNDQALFHNVVGTYLQFGLDAVRDPATGNIVCRAVLQGNPAAAGCVPLNLFGSNNADPAALAYAFRTLYEFSTLKQEVVSGNIRGQLFSGFGAGPVDASFGLEARRDTADVTHDLANQPWYDEYFLSYGLDYAGKISVVEGYGEVNVPVLKDRTFAKYLEFDGAIRETNNKNTDETVGSATEGESVTHNIPSWKLSFIWDLSDWLRLRGTRSRDVRAAGFRELYESYAVTAGGPFGTIMNPKPKPGEPLVYPITALTGGNINLEPENADTITAGFVVAPKSGPFERFQFSADWYRIVLNNPITGPPFGLGVQNIVSLCAQGQQALCDRITFGTPGDFGTITTVNNTAVNLGRYETRGVDFEVMYRLPLQDLSNSVHGDLSFRLLTSWLYNMTIDTGQGNPPVDYAGQTGPTAAFGGFNTSPRWQSNFFVTYGNGPFTGTLQVRYIAHGIFEAVTPLVQTPVAPGDPGYSTTNPNSINTNSVASATYLNLSASYDVSSHFSVFATINNLLNKDPPIAPGGNGYPTNPVYFDTYGMFWRLGVRARF
jgi:outer membrane receptor protein involved in Fe transport